MLSRNSEAAVRVESAPQGETRLRWRGGRGRSVDEAARVLENVAAHVPDDVQDGERNSDGNYGVREESAVRLHKAIGRCD